jgi:hypothetical protein
MNSGPARLFSPARVLVFLVLWTVLVVLIFTCHLPLGLYHGKSWYDFLPCVISVWPAPGVACACLVFIQWLWVTNISALRKLCFTVLAIAITLPAVMTLGFFWLLMHMAP